MLISTKGRYALRVMIDLADNNNGEYVTLRDIAERQGISEKYLESIIVILSRAGMVDGLRGKGGGYRLNRAPSEYTVGEILGLVENTLAPVSCLDCGQRGCGKAAECRTLTVWQNLSDKINDYLASVTLADL
ncbi:MAG: Rrf2 family transcriptional regulator [Ruminococcaceae bacterium]|nr:Rrf2 family transcriptional regulator [Oscillospiraceae bacterium]